MANQIDMPYMQAARVLALLLLQVHLSRRVVETAYMMKYPLSARMHLVAYVFGLRCESLFMQHMT